jgi:hypothetical protein
VFNRATTCIASGTAARLRRWRCFRWAARMNSLIRVAILLFVGGTLFSDSMAQVRSFSQSQEQQLRVFLQMYLNAPKSGVDPSTRYSFAIVNLGDSNGKEVVVYVTGRWSCGNGGCLVLVLAPEGMVFKVIGRLTIARLPVQVLRHKTNGWHDLRVWMQGGGVQQGHFGVFAFDGARYPNNPSIAPESAGSSTGEVELPLKRKGDLLYP